MKRGIKKCLELTNFKKRNAGEWGRGFSSPRTTADSQIYNEEMEGLLELEAAASWDPHEVSLAAHLKDSLLLGATLVFFSLFLSPEIRAQALHHQVRTSKRLKFPPLALTSCIRRAHLTVP